MKKKKKVNWCFTPSQSVRLYQGEEEEEDETSTTKSETERGPESLYKMNKEGSSIPLETRHTNTTTRQTNTTECRTNTATKT